MIDPFYEEERIRKEFVYHPRRVKEIFNHMKSKLNSYDEKWEQGLFDADMQREKMNIDRHVINVEDLQ